MENNITRVIKRINPDSNGGEDVSFIVEYRKFSDFTKKTFKVEVCSYANMASLLISNTITPEMLEELASEMRKVEQDINHPPII